MCRGKLELLDLLDLQELLVTKGQLDPLDKKELGDQGGQR